MKIDINYLLKEKNELVAIVFLVFSLFLAVILLFKITKFFTTSVWAQKVVTSAIEQRETQLPDTEQYLSRDRQFARTLNEGNLFVRRASPENPVNEVRGIWIDSVLINDNWYKVDDVIEGARIVSIEPTQVQIEWEGRTYTYSPIEASIPEPQQTARATARRSTRSLPVAENLVAASQNIGATAVSAGGGARIETETSGRTARWGMQQGDIVVSINGNRVSGGDSLVEVMNSIESYSAVEVQIIRNGVPMTVGRDQVTGGGRGARGGNTAGGRGGGGRGGG